jgi:hypothetical protein
MAYNELILRGGGRKLRFYLNQDNLGWVPQILNGSFGVSREYTFEKNTPTAMVEKAIDINVRLTPVVPIPKTSAKSFFSFFASSSTFNVELLDYTYYVPNLDYFSDKITPRITYKYLNGLRQECIIRELKYNHSEYPATIEFTITTTKPFLYGYPFTLYVGLGEQDWTQSLKTFRDTVLKIESNFNLVTFYSFELSLPQVEKDFGHYIFPSRIFGQSAYVRGSSTPGSGLFKLDRDYDGYQTYSIYGGFDKDMSLMYPTDAYPSFTIISLMHLLDNIPEPPKVNFGNLGPGFSKITLISIEKGL